MNLSASDRALGPSATDADTQASRWLERRNFGDWDDNVQAEFDAWMNASSSNEVAFLRLEAAWARTGRLVILRTPDKMEVAPKSRLFPAIVAIAASLAVLAVIGATTGKLFNSASQVRTYATPIGGHEVVSFADGTKIELNTNTVLRAQMMTDRRTVWLDKGEAYFQVKHDPAHPFTVFVGDHRIMDVGTKFLVRRDFGRLEVAVQQGRVAFKTSNKDAPLQSALLSRGDAVVATADSTVMSKISPAELESELTWRRGLLVFQHTTLAEAVAEFNRYNRTKLVIVDPVAANRRIGATFPVNDVERFARVARDVLGLRVVHRKNEIVIE